MKYFKKAVWIAVAFCGAVLLYAAVGFRVDDMTLSKGEIATFNTGWTLMRQSGEGYVPDVTLESLPYLGKSEPGERILLENRIPSEFYGKTISFLSADKTISVKIDGESVYGFGLNDKRSFGKTPGSVVNFIDIPADLTEGIITIESTSPYPDYAARVTEITVGDRDVLILSLLKDNMFEIGCNLLIVVCGIMFLLLSIIMKFSKQESGGVEYLCGYCVVAALYYCVETKILHIFFGNQTFYSVMVFVSIMLIPFFIALYYANGIFREFKLRWRILLGLICGNIVIQMGLQLCNVLDFMEMSYASHGLIMLTIVIVAKSYFDIRKERRDMTVRLGMLALLFMGIGGAVDIVRMYVVAVGDMGMFSRLGSACFSIIMLYQHFRQMIQGYANNMAENARLLQNKMELIEKANEELKAANELAEEARQDAIAANASKGKFLAHMSHEIRTPINAVLGMDTMILRETKDAQIKEYAMDIQNAGQNLLALINDILDFSKIESGKLDIINVEYDLSSLIHDIFNMIKAKAEAKKLELVIHADETLPSKLFGDDVRIRQVLVNLLNNAVKYTKEGKVTLTVKGRTEGRKVIFDFAVSDTGIGIKEEDIAKLFQEFERIEEKRNRNIEGTGLGINITTQLLQLMRSKLNVESEYGKGSRFFFTLEQQIVDSTPIGNLEQRIKEQSTEYAYMATFTAPEARILVVDDNLTNLKVFVNLLKYTRVNIDVAESGKDCLALIARNEYDLIFLDHMMPEMDGIETLHRMKELPESKCERTPVIALTANAITGAKEMYLKEGFDAFLPKPINPDKLEQMILRLLPRYLLKFDAEEELLEEVALTEGVKGEPEEDGTELPMIDGIDWSYGLMHLPDRELLLDTVKDFYKALTLEADALDRFFSECKENPEALVQYRIKVHAMKSAANLIGAVMLGGMAKRLENAAAEGDVEKIEVMHGIFTADWRSYKEKLKVCVAEEKEAGKEAASNQDEILASLDALCRAMEEMDIDAMDAAMAELERFTYPSVVQEDIDTLGGLVINMDGEQAVTLVEQIKVKLFQGGDII